MTKLNTKPTSPPIVPPVEEENTSQKPQGASAKRNQIPDAGYNYILTEVSKERYDNKLEEENIEALAKLEILKKQIFRKIQFYTRERRKNKLRAFSFRVLSTFLAAVVTILLGLNFEGFEKLFNTLALIISGFITVIGILQKFLDSKDLWVRFTETVGKLEALQFSINYLQESKGAIKLKDVEYIKLKYDKIMEETVSFVVNVRAEDGQQD
ncbi:SLATT domain-containing protein [Flexithrix dorotheae]|uniref:SLATT domain-containing protein n=1 Tax=Flexithrix dorotheae TaxID=70993 RepID=UPI0012F75D26|nr:SLATT domain-containing protein [Flexithrix dorotheae]